MLCLPIAMVTAFAVSLYGQEAVTTDLTPHEINILQGQSPASGQIATGQEQATTPRRFNYGLSLSVRGVYDDNILLRTVNIEDDFYFAIEPIITFGFGGDNSPGSSSLSFTYRPGFFIFLDHSEEDTIQHLLHLTGSHVFSRLAVSLSQDVQILTGGDLNSLSDPTGHNANIDVGQRTDHNIYTTGLSDTYDLTGKLFLSNSFGFVVDSYPSGMFNSSRNFSGNLFLNYNYSDKLTIGLGGTGGYDNAEGSTNQVYEQANLRFSYSPTGKLSLSFSVGAEFRQFDNDTGTHVSPTFDLTSSYRPFDGTSITLSGSQHIENSASLTGQDYTDTNFHFSVSQRFLSRFFLGLAVGYERSSYFSAVPGVNANRDDDYYYVQPSIDATITRWWSAGAYYLYRKDDSTDPRFRFEDNQVGIRSTVTF